ncbi:MAG: hypothetical protein ABIJ57_02545 [Pseudomonadota bacterium]
MRRLVVCMSDGTTVADWERQGIAEREVALYLQLPVETYLVTADREAQIDGVTCLTNRWSLLPRLFNLLVPVLSWRTLRTCDLVRGHNGRALLTPLLIHWLHRIPLVCRCGYLWSWDAVRRGVAPWKLWAILLLERMAFRSAMVVSVPERRQAEYLHVVHHL